MINYYGRRCRLSISELERLVGEVLKGTPEEEIISKYNIDTDSIHHILAGNIVSKEGIRCSLADYKPVDRVSKSKDKVNDRELFILLYKLGMYSKHIDELFKLCHTYNVEFKKIRKIVKMQNFYYILHFIFIF